MSLTDKLQKLHSVIAETEKLYHRRPGDVLLLAVTKQQNSQTIRDAFQLGLKDFGENYYQEAMQKITELQDLTISWHFIGPIQSNKTKGIAENFNWVHGIDRLKIAMDLNKHRPYHLPPLNVCLQIQLIPEQTKSGIMPKEAAELAFAVSQLPHLKLRGLMTIPPILTNEEEQYRVFLQLKNLMETLNQQLNLSMDTLSMGMTDDLKPAIKAGATIIRIGRALFGERN